MAALWNCRRPCGSRDSYQVLARLLQYRTLPAHDAHPHPRCG